MLVIALLLVGCSATKNTAFTRFYHRTTTNYNINFNGRTSYQEGMDNIFKANKDNYSDVIPLFPISNHESAQAGTGQMDRSIEKCRKAIKLHSIQKKPKRDPKRWNDPEYQVFYNQTEFNSALSDAWLMLAKSEFHKADFVGAIGTFNYVSRHYANDKDIVAQCQLWTVRAYAEMGWIYEAEEVLGRVKQDELKRANSLLYAEVNADLLLKKKQYKEAIPFVKLAAQGQKRTRDKSRFDFVLGQLYQREGNNLEATEAYKRVIKRNPPVEMEFNARLNANELSSDKKKAVKQFLKMADDYKYKDNLDQIYGAVGNLYLAEKDTLKAIEYYTQAIDKSTQNGMPKASVLVTLADLHYSLRNYALAQPCYAEAATILPVETEGYGRISHLGETLGELVVHQDIVVLQDSLQHLATLPEDQLQAVIRQIIVDLENAERAEAERLAALENEEDGLVSVNTQGMIGNIGAADWYFYNTNLLNSGKTDFRKKWGQRKLEDNWRRQSKAVTSQFENEQYANDGTLIADSVSTQVNMDTAANNPKNPAFYLKQIPRTPEMINASNEQIATALYNLGVIYKDKVQDIPLSLETFDKLEQRFPQDSRMSDVYFMRYLTFLQQGDTVQSEHWRQELLVKYPDCKQANILVHSDYVQRMLRMEQEQDSLYEATYKSYLSSHYDRVFQNKRCAEQEYPLSPLMPKFYFLNALAVAKTQTPQAFAEALREMIGKYPESEVTAMAKDMLGLINQGMESQTGESHGTLLARREETDNPVDTDTVRQADLGFTTEDAPACLLIIINNDKDSLNNLLYQVALFNFSQFLIKAFDMELGSYGQNEGVLKISNLENYKEAKWYEDLLRKDMDLSNLFVRLDARLIKISMPNLELLQRGLLSEDEYLLFEHQNL